MKQKIDTLDPKEYGLSPRTHLETSGENSITIVVRRKSRIIMADGKKLVEKARHIQQLDPSVTVGIITTAPVCSKTRIFLQESGIVVQEE